MATETELLAQLELLAADQQSSIQNVPKQESEAASTAHEEQIFALARDAAARDINALPWLPELPESWAQDIYEKVEEQERRLAAPNLQDDEYLDGTALVADEIAEVSGRGSYLFTAEHATKTVRKATGKIGFPDAGTAGLAAVLAQEHGTALIMRGKQTSNPATDPDHPIKGLIREYLPDSAGFLSVHGMAPGKFLTPTDRTEIQAIIGLGIEPTEEMRELAYRIKRMGHEVLGLNVAIGNDIKYYVQKEHSTEIKYNEDGSPFMNTLAALKPDHTTNFVRRELDRMAKQAPAMQVELTRLLRIVAVENEKRDIKSKIMGVALGYKLLDLCVELSLEYQAETQGQDI